MQRALSKSELERPVGRLAPSPTGSLHLGHARTFLLAWWHARSRGGRIVLRIEDLDRTRVRPGMIEQCVEDLRWLGLDWDGPIRIQSEGESELRAAALTLLERGLAYPCVCTRREIERARSAPHADEHEPPYPGTCRGRFATIEEARASTGREPALRFRVPTGSVHFVDALHGPSSFDVAAEVGDFPITSREGQVAYQLAVVVDDARDGVNEVVRGEDLLPSAARQALLQDALGLPRPAWYHVPLVTDAGQRLAKRTDALSLRALRAAGASPRAIISWAARSSGHDVPPGLAAADLLPTFRLALHGLPVAPTLADLLPRDGFPPPFA